MNPNNVTVSNAVAIGDVNESLNSATHGMIEQISVLYQDYNSKVVSREDERIEFKEQVRISPANSKGVPSGPSVTVESRDLSFWGISVLSPQPFEVDTYLVIEFTLPNNDVDHTVTILGQVRHRRSEGDDQLIGFKFIATLND